MRPARFTVQQIPIDEISIGPNRRPVDWAAVDALVESIREIGLRTPVTVRRSDHIDEDGVIAGQDWTLIAGRHRLEAARKLGWPEIDVIFVDCDEIDAELYEISENLHRADLTKEQRDQQIRRFVELLGRKEEAARKAAEEAAEKAAEGISGQNVRVFPKRGRGQPKSLETKVAEMTGLSARTVKRAMNPPQQKPKVVRVPDVPLTDQEVAEQQCAALVALWNKTGDLGRQMFREEVLDPPIMDARFGTNPHTGTANGEGIPAFIRKDRA